MHARYTVIIRGVDFLPCTLLNELDTDFVFDEDSFITRGDPMSKRKDEFYESGTLFLFHENEFSKEYPDPDYELSFVEFFEKNYDLLVSAGAQEFTIFLDVYFADQCNFEIFDKDMLRRLSKYNVSLPISVYSVKNNVIPAPSSGLRRVGKSVKG